MWEEVSYEVRIHYLATGSTRVLQFTSPTAASDLMGKIIREQEEGKLTVKWIRLVEVRKKQLRQWRNRDWRKYEGPVHFKGGNRA